MCKQLLLSGRQDTLDGDGGADLAATDRIRNGWLKFRDFFLQFPSRGR